MAFLWLSASFNFYLIQFLINTFEEVYVTAIGSSIADIVAQSIAGYVYERIGIRATISIANGASTVGGLIILFFALQH